MPYLLDTDVVIDYLAGVPATVQLVSELAPQGITISIVTYMEAYQGVLRAPDPVNAQSQFDAFVQAVPIAPISESIAQRCARLREDLKRSGKRVRSRALDLLVAAAALEHNLILITRNTDDYKDIPGLNLMRVP